RAKKRRRTKALRLNQNPLNNFMSLTDSTLRIVLYEGTGAEPLASSERFAAITGLLEKGFSVTRTSGGGKVAPADHSSILVLGRFPGEMPQVEDIEGKVPVHFQNVSDFDAARVQEVVEKKRAELKAAAH